MLFGLLAILTNPFQLKVVLDNGKLVFAAEIANKLFQFWRLDGFSVLATDAIEMVMMRNERLSEFVVVFPANCNGTNDVQLIKGNKCAVDAGSVNVFALLCNITNG